MTNFLQMLPKSKLTFWAILNNFTFLVKTVVAMFRVTFVKNWHLFTLTFGHADLV